MRTVILALALVACNSPPAGVPSAGSGPTPSEAPASATTASKAPCLMTLHIEHGTSLLGALRAAGVPAADFPKLVPARAIDPATFTPIAPLADLRVGDRPLFWIPATKDGAVVDASAFGELEVVDATRIRQGTRAAVGRVLDAARAALGDRRVAEALLRASVVRPYVHLYADVCLRSESARDGAWTGELDGEHVFVTNARSHEPLAFAIEIAKDGSIMAIGRR